MGEGRCLNVFGLCTPRTSHLLPKDKHPEATFSRPSPISPQLPHGSPPSHKMEGPFSLQFGGFLEAPRIRHPSQLLPSLPSVLDTTPRGLCTLPASLGCCFSCLSATPSGPQHPPKTGGRLPSLSSVSLRADKKRVGLMMRTRPLKISLRQLCPQSED